MRRESCTLRHLSPAATQRCVLTVQPREVMNKVAHFRQRQVEELLLGGAVVGKTKLPKPPRASVKDFWVHEGPARPNQGG